MPRHINADNTLKSIDKAIQKYAENDDVLEFISELRYSVIGQPTADVQEIKHGKWIKDIREQRDDGEIYDYCCSECCELAAEDDYDNHAVLSAYCPHCGAKMDRKDW